MFVTLTSAEIRAAPSTLPSGPEVLGLEARAVFEHSLREFGAGWDAGTGLLEPHGVRSTAMYAVALLFRDAPGDRDRATSAIRGVLAQQMREPGAVYHGTFYRRVSEPRLALGSKATVWKDYDPNWRQFIGCCWCVILQRFSDRIPEEVRAELVRSLTEAVEGEMGARRLGAGYTNIAIMHAYVARVTAEVTGRSEFAAEGDRYVREIYALFSATDTFGEYNSPTYYGVDLYALSLWRGLGPTVDMREKGSEMERKLWLDTAAFYHAGMRNLCGPFDRTYGMDMTRYVALVGLYLRMEMSGEVAPHPALGAEMGHRHDLAAGMIYPVIGTRIPEEAMAEFRAFSGDRLVGRKLPDDRRASAWLSHRVMLGGQRGAKARNVANPTSQFRPAVVHWMTPGGKVGWAALVQGDAVQAEAGEGRLTISVRGGLTMRVACDGALPEQFKPDRWLLPGLSVLVDHDGNAPVVSVETDYIDLVFKSATRLEFRVQESDK